MERYNRSLLKLMSSSTKMSSLNLLIARGRILMGWSVDHPWGGGISEALMPIANPPVRWGSGLLTQDESPLEVLTFYGTQNVSKWNLPSAVPLEMQTKGTWATSWLQVNRATCLRKVNLRTLWAMRGSWGEWNNLGQAQEAPRSGYWSRMGATQLQMSALSWARPGVGHSSCWNQVLT